jgi:hypothetical protein
MNDAYKIAVKIALVENVTRGLQMMGRHFRTTDAEAKALEARLKSIGKLTMVGGAFAAAGAFGLGLFKKPLEEAMEYERKLASLRQQGLGDAQVSDARKYAEATKIIGTSMQDRLRIMSEAQGSFRESGKGGSQALVAAKTMMPILAQYEVATKMLGGPHQGAAEGSMRNLNKIVEMMGGLGDTNRAKAIADGVFKAAQSSGRMVDERQLKQFVAYGSSATNQLSMRTIFGGLEPIIGEMGGSTVGTGLRTAYNRVNGMLALMPHRTKEEMLRLGMASGDGSRQTDALAKMQATDTIAYTQEIMRRYASKGITGQVDRERENAILFGTNGAKIMNKLMSQMPVLQESLASYDKAKGAGDVADDPRNKALRMQIDLEAKETDLKLQIGRVAMPAYLYMLEKTRDVLMAISNFAANNPTIFKGLVLAFGALSAAALAGGSLAVLVGGLRAFALLSGPLSTAWTVLRVGGTALLWLGRALMVFGRMLLVSNPIGWALLAIIAVGWLVWNNWKEIKKSFMASFINVKDGLKKLFNGDILGAMAQFSIALVRGWQTMLNTLLAGINTILPSALQIGKLNFADKYASLVAPDTGNVRPGGKGNAGGGHIYMDGKKVGDIVSGHQAHAMSRPNAGGSAFDPTRARPAVAGGR